MKSVWGWIVMMQLGVGIALLACILRVLEAIYGALPK